MATSERALADQTAIGFVRIFVVIGCREIVRTSFLSSKLSFERRCLTRRCILLAEHCWGIPEIFAIDLRFFAFGGINHPFGNLDCFGYSHDQAAFTISERCLSI